MGPYRRGKYSTIYLVCRAILKSGKSGRTRSTASLSLPPAAARANLLHTFEKRLDRARSILARTIKKWTQLATSRGVTQFPQGLRFDLTYSLSSHRKVLPHFLQSMITAIIKAKAHLDDLL